jgi:hypothetical protein
MYLAGFSSALPYLALFIVTVAAGRVVDLLRSRHVFTTVQLRKAGTCIAFVLAATFLVLTG